MKSSTQLILLSLTLIFTACASPVYRLTPEQEAEWIQGTQYVTQEQNGVTAVMSYTRHNDGMITFDLQMINQSGEKMKIDPKQFFYVAYDSHPYKTEGNRLDSRFVIDPEAKILEIDKIMARRRTARSVEQFLDATIEIANIAHDISTDSYNSRGYTERAIERRISAENFDDSMSSLENQRFAWSNLALRRTDLGNDQEVNGFINIPHHERSRFIEIHLPIPELDTEFRFLYNQEKFK